MGIVKGTLTPYGAIVDVLIGVSKDLKEALQRAGRSAPKKVKARAVIDTGSALTGFTANALKPLGIEPFRHIPVSTPSTPPDRPHRCAQYHVSLSIVSGVQRLTFTGIHIIAPEEFNRQEGIQGLIGLDVLNYCTFQYFGPDQQFTLAY